LILLVAGAKLCELVDGRGRQLSTGGRVRWANIRDLLLDIEREPRVRRLVGPTTSMETRSVVSMIVRCWARWVHRHLPRDGAVLVEPVRPDVCCRNPFNLASGVRSYIHLLKRPYKARRRRKHPGRAAIVAGVTITLSGSCCSPSKIEAAGVTRW
jgi:hypothetical protein